jgi:hypothetical protein
LKLAIELNKNNNVSAANFNNNNNININSLNSEGFKGTTEVCFIDFKVFILKNFYIYNILNFN